MGLAERLNGQHLKPRNISELKTALESIFRDLSQHCPDVKIILFGSFAKKTANQDSDLDLAVVIPDTVNKKEFRKSFYKSRTAVHIAVDFIFRNQSEYLSMSDENPIDTEIRETGIEIYPVWKFL
jgi:predicted nucleotidyltransferase